MNFEITTELLETIKSYIEKANTTIATENKDWKGRTYKSDFITIDDKNNVGFEVFGLYPKKRTLNKNTPCCRIRNYDRGLSYA